MLCTLNLLRGVSRPLLCMCACQVQIKATYVHKSFGCLSKAFVINLSVSEPVIFLVCKWKDMLLGLEHKSIFVGPCQRRFCKMHVLIHMGIR